MPYRRLLAPVLVSLALLGAACAAEEADPAATSRRSPNTCSGAGVRQSRRSPTLHLPPRRVSPPLPLSKRKPLLMLRPTAETAASPTTEEAPEVEPATAPEAEPEATPEPDDHFRSRGHARTRSRKPSLRTLQNPNRKPHRRPEVTPEPEVDPRTRTGGQRQNRKPPRKLLPNQRPPPNPKPISSPHR